MKSARRMESGFLKGVVENFTDVFDEDWLPDGVYKMEIDTSVKPVKLLKGKVPMALLQPLKAYKDRELYCHFRKSLPAFGAIRKPSGKLRIRIEPKRLKQHAEKKSFPPANYRSPLSTSDTSKGKMLLGLQCQKLIVAYGSKKPAI